MFNTSRIMILAALGAVLLAPIATSRAAAQGAQAMLQQAATENKHLVVLAWSRNDDTTQKLKAMMEEARVSLDSKALFYAFNTDDTANKDFVAKYRLAAAPLPLILVFAPNGVVVGAFSRKVVDEKMLTDSFASPKLASVLKLLQEGNTVLLCVQTATTAHNAESLKAAQAAAADDRAKGKVQIVELDPTEGTSTDLVAALKLPPALEDATIRIIVPPGTVAGEVKGATTQAAVSAAIAKALATPSGGCSGGSCGAGGCK